MVSNVVCIELPTVHNFNDLNGNYLSEAFENPIVRRNRRC